MIIILLSRDIIPALLCSFINLTTMRLSKPQPTSQPISQELTNFFTLLHRDHTSSSIPQQAEIPLVRRLSVILSTSQHDSSQTQGTSLNGTGHVKDVRLGRGMEAIRDVVRELFRSELAPLQVELLKMLEGLVEELHEQYQHRVSQLLTSDRQSKPILIQQPQKTKTSHHTSTHNLQAPFQLIQMQQQLTQLQSDNTFLKTLIILANESYESLQTKLSTLSLQRKHSIASTSHRTKSKLSIEDVGSCNERSRSPRMRSHVGLPKAEEVYRKMVKRVLRQGNHLHTVK